MAKPITVGIDGSARAWQALDWAAEQSRSRGAPMVLVHASRALVRGGSLPDDAVDRLGAERMDLLKEAQQYALKQSGDLDIDLRLMTQDPAHALEAESGRSSLIAVGARGAGGFESLLLGSVALHVAAHSHCPAVIVPGSAPHPLDAPAEILLGIEGRHPEDHAIGWAFEEADRRGARVVALHAMGGDFGAPHQRVVEDMEIAEALAGWSSRYPDVQVTPVVSEHGAARALVHASAKAALLVIGRSRRPGRVGVVLGRVTLPLIHHSRCPVVMVP